MQNTERVVVDQSNYFPLINDSLKILEVVLVNGEVGSKSVSPSLKTTSQNEEKLATTPHDAAKITKCKGSNSTGKRKIISIHDEDEANNIILNLTDEEEDVNPKKQNVMPRSNATDMFNVEEKPHVPSTWTQPIYVKSLTRGRHQHPIYVDLHLEGPQLR